MQEAVRLNLPERKEIWLLLDRLSPFERRRFLDWACEQTPRKGPVKLKVTTFGGTSQEAYWDLVQLSLQGLDLNRAVIELERRVKKRGASSL